MPKSSDTEANRFSARAARYARVGAQVGGVAARIAGARMLGGPGGDAASAAALMRTLGGLKGPMMKVAQMMATVPDLLPPAYADELQKLQNDAPPMGAAFVKRRMQSELGPAWADRFATFDLKPAAAASLGQVHRATAHDGTRLACKLQYPDMRSAVEADLGQLEMLLSLHRRMNPAVDLRDAAKEIGARVREELDYEREANHASLYAAILAPFEDIRVPGVHRDLSTERLLVLDWLDGEKLLAFRRSDEAMRNRIATAMFNAWWYPFSHYGVIHGDPHLGNYTIFGDAEGLNLLDYGCVRLFPPSFVQGLVDLYEGLRSQDRDRLMHAYEVWGFKGLTRDLVETLNIWANFMFGPILTDRVRTIADGVSPGQYGRREAFQLHQALKRHGPLQLPREFVFMDRAAIGLGSVFLHLNAKLNFHRLFQALLENFDQAALAKRQQAALASAGLPQPA